jgi:competence ComEA-like helix-hairpin-helix protein
VANRAPITLNSWDEVQEHITAIVGELNKEPRLALAAAANPFEALEELGYHVDAAARPEIEDRLRFPTREAVRRKQLRTQIFELVGHPVDLSSADELRTVLYDELSITPYPDERGCYPDLPSTYPPRKPASGEPEPDPLLMLEGRHPVMEPLLEYRLLDAAHAPFAPRVAFEAIRAGEASGGVRNFRIRLKNGRDGGREAREVSPPSPAAERTTEGGGQSRLDINTASARELEGLPGIGEKLAARIVTYRKRHGRFENPDGLRSVPGITDQLLTKLEPFITTNP